MSLFFTVAMSVYDGVSLRQIENSILSILNQDYENFEFIIILDGITRPELKSKILSYNDNNCKIRVLDCVDNRGLAVAMNKAISLMKGDVFVRMDADDISMSNRLTEISIFFDQNPDIDVVGSYIQEIDLTNFSVEERLYHIDTSNDISKNSLVKYPVANEDIVNLFKYRNSIAHPSAAIRKKVFELVPSYPVFSLRNEDTLLWLSIMKVGFKFSNINKPLYLLHFAEDSVSRRNSIKKAYSDMLDRMRVIFDLKGNVLHVMFAISLFILTITPLYSFIRKLSLRAKKS
jgi:glycosyltransferase involved in cell wall biosynthesis